MLDPKVRTKLMAFKTRLSRNTPVHKFEILMQWLEVQVMESILKGKTNRERGELLRNSVALEEREGVRGVLGLESTVPKSSLFGRDPFGDNKELPEECYGKEKARDLTSSDGDTDEDTEVEVSLEASPKEKSAEGETIETDDLSAEAGASVTAETAGPSGEQEKQSASAGKGKKKTGGKRKSKKRQPVYTRNGLRLKRLQEQCRDVIKVAIYYLIDPEMTTMLRRREAYYRNSPGALAQTPRGTMPWKEYKELLMSVLMRTPGWRELRILCNTERPDGSLPMAWLRVMSRGREIVRGYDHNLSDFAYVNRVLRYTTPHELQMLEKTMYDYGKEQESGFSMEQARYDLKRLSWDDFYKVMELVLGSYQRKYFRRYSAGARKDRTKQNRNPSGNRRTNPKPGGKRRRAEETGTPKPTRKPPCEKCMRAKLYIQAKTHTTEECDDEKRKGAEKKKQSRRQKYRGTRSQGPRSGRRSASNERAPPRKDVKCEHCVRAGRKHVQHRAENCLYETEWKGLKGDALKKAQKEYYQKKKEHTTKLAQVLAQVSEKEESEGYETDSENWYSEESESDENHIPV